MPESSGPGGVHKPFKSAHGRPGVNPYVERIREYAPWAATAEEGEAMRGRWREVMGFGPDAPLLLEVGPGNGFFFRQLAQRSPDAAHVAVEIRFKRVWLTAHKARQWDLENIRVVHHHAGNLDALFAPGEVDAVYVNHPDPWPKERHHKHRLLQGEFLVALARALRLGGEVWVKSDYEPYGPWVRREFDTPLWTPIDSTDELPPQGEPLELDLGDAGGAAAEIGTNYERKKRAEGCRILLAGFARTGHPLPPTPGPAA